MITVEEHEAIRRAYYLEKKSKRQIAREQGHSRKTIDKAIENRPAQPYRLTQPKPAPVFGAYRERTDELLAENAHLPKPPAVHGAQDLRTPPRGRLPGL